ncbi:hypothetical protein ZIOFF_005462 [Zingiber officinale]|uniref:Uncharacterized protein n=1 Tax=Zingiber officinale TaxID=94328 RepID=A0A8J5IAQ2_ZINOF|nr:hypothetical protein ZIOFF_005462 [Zingiber officinale]
MQPASLHPTIIPAIWVASIATISFTGCHFFLFHLPPSESSVHRRVGLFFRVSAVARGYHALPPSIMSWPSGQPQGDWHLLDCRSIAAVTPFVLGFVLMLCISEF